MKPHRLFDLRRMTFAALFAASAFVLSGCSTGGAYPGVPALSSTGNPAFTGKLAARQVGYRIDATRFFEVVPHEDSSCSAAQIFYTDTAKGIHSLVMNMEDRGGLDIVIDAANEQYLVAPLSRGNTSCSSGGGTCGGARLIYSTDAGRTWKRAPALAPDEKIIVSGSVAYTVNLDNLVRALDLQTATPKTSDWKYLPEFNPVIRIKPSDKRFHCTPNDKE